VSLTTAGAGRKQEVWSTAAGGEELLAPPARKDDTIFKSQGAGRKQEVSLTAA